MNEMWVGFISNAKLAELQAGNRCGQHGARTPEWMGLGSLSAQVKEEGRVESHTSCAWLLFPHPQPAVSWS